MTILECSTGNAGTACAWVATLLGYDCIITMPVGMSDERKKLMRAYGAELVFTPGGESDVDLALEKAFEIKAEEPEKYWIPNQFDNNDNVMAHYITTGPEIWEQTEGNSKPWSERRAAEAASRASPNTSGNRIQAFSSGPSSPKNARCSPRENGAPTASRASATASSPGTCTSST